MCYVSPSCAAPNQRRRLLILVLSSVVVSLPLSVAVPQASPAATVTIDTQTVTNTNARLLLGQSFDARASYGISGKSVGYYNPATGQPLDLTPGTGMTWMWEQLDQTSLRYPQGPVNTWNWKATIGPIGTRGVQLSSGGNVANFGLHEFLAMAESQGVAPANVNWMVNIYGDINNKNKPQAIQDAADLIEYLNMPSGAGYAWADLRATNGHPAPYGVKLFNLGNEPWATAGPPTEYNYLSATGAADYASDAGEFITAMKAVDPSIRITLAATAGALNPANQAKAVAWNQTLLDQRGSDIYALATNLYYDSTIPHDRGVPLMESFLDGVIGQVDNFNQSHANQVKVIIGEHGNAITSSIGNTDPDFAMQWQGAVTTADFLNVLSQKPLLERAHSFIWGNGARVWHPMRLDGYDNQGNPLYTFLPMTGLYDELGDFVLQNALAISTTSSPTIDGLNPYSVSAAAYLSADGTLLNLMLVNIDPDAAGGQHVSLAGLGSFQLSAARLLSGASPDAETLTATDLASSPLDSEFFLPNQSILLLEFQAEAVPEPGTLGLAVCGSTLLVWARFWCRRRRTPA